MATTRSATRERIGEGKGGAVRFRRTKKRSAPRICASDRAARGTTRPASRRALSGEAHQAYKLRGTPEKPARKTTARKPTKKRALLAKKIAATTARRTTKVTSRKAAPRRRAPLIPPHKASPRPGRRCKHCGKPHSTRAHGSHALGKPLAWSYKTRREGIFAKPTRGKKRTERKTARRPGGKRAAR